MTKLASEASEDIVVEFAGEAIGWIRADGTHSRELSAGFLDEWRRDVEGEWSAVPIPNALGNTWKHCRNRW